MYDTCNKVSILSSLRKSMIRLKHFSILVRLLFNSLRNGKGKIVQGRVRPDLCVKLKEYGRSQRVGGVRWIWKCIESAAEDWCRARTTGKSSPGQPCLAKVSPRPDKRPFESLIVPIFLGENWKPKPRYNLFHVHVFPIKFQDVGGND